MSNADPAGIYSVERFHKENRQVSTRNLSIFLVALAKINPRFYRGNKKL